MCYSVTYMKMTKSEFRENGRLRHISLQTIDILYLIIFNYNILQNVKLL